MIARLWSRLCRRLLAWRKPPAPSPPRPSPFLREMQDYYAYGVHQKWASLRARSKDRERTSFMADDLLGGGQPPERRTR